MATPTSSVHICNLALDRLGQREIASIDDPTTENENICSRHYDQTRRKALRKYIFNFSKKYVSLTKSATKTPAFGYSSAYALPNDFVRLLALGDTTVMDDVPAGLYDLSEGYIFTDAAGGGTLFLTYVYDAKTVSVYDPLFIDVFTLELAAAMAYKFTLKQSLVNALKSDLLDAQMAASAVAGQEKPPRRIQTSYLITARRMGLGRRDNSRYP